VIVGDGQTGLAAIPLRCRNGTPVPFLTPRGQRRLQPLTLTGGPNTLTVELVSTQPSRPRSWRAAAAGSPARARKFNRAGYRPGGGFEMFGGGGNDVLQVRQRQNILRGQQGNDSLTGGPRRDFLVGGRGDDVINGGGGKNTIVGGAGNDTLIGGLDRDMFVYRRVNHGTDLIQNYQPGVDVIDLRRIFARAPFQVAGRSNYQRLNTFVRLIEREGNTLVQIDRNGKQAGKFFNTLAVLEGIAVSQLSSCDFVV
ncbi:type I secretion C-terminal target domain-containing protein, partial [Thermoleptolyngbya sp. M55_K2018_002]|uniref:type I secretion C-terminal target domain-containing protein n=1 Tax=Thermoleptolyngbya sp. M55_K2018_002 TaxID=2747808 RepID=UPI001A0A40C0